MRFYAVIAAGLFPGALISVVAQKISSVCIPWMASEMADAFYRLWQLTGNVEAAAIAPSERVPPNFGWEKVCRLKAHAERLALALRKT